LAGPAPLADDISRRTADIDLAEMQQRAGALARELGQQYGFNVREWRTYWSDMTQTALLLGETRLRMLLRKIQV